MYNVHIVEVGTKVVAAPNSVNITQHQYGSLIHSSQNITKAVQSKCGITAQMLVTEYPFRHVLEELFAWISSRNRTVATPQILSSNCSHNGFVFELLELHRRTIPFHRLISLNLHFVDNDCKKTVRKLSDSVIFANCTAAEKLRK